MLKPTKPSLYRRRVTITQPYVPGYRYALFDAVVSELRSLDIEARVFYDARFAAEISQRRGDAVEASWSTAVSSARLQLQGATFQIRKLPKGWSHPAVLLTELAAGNGNAWYSAAKKQKFILMGQGKSYTNTESSISVRMESFLARRAAHVLTYTDSGMQAVLDRSGVSTQQVSSFRNTTDTRALQAKPSPEETLRFRHLHGIPESAECAIFVGALEQFKGVDLLVSAAAQVFSRHPTAHLIVAGSGPEVERIDDLADQTGRVTRLGHVKRSDLRVPASAARIIVCPGRVGLIAVDALALQLPLLTTNFAFHAPEIEYLTQGQSLHTSEPSPDKFSEAWIRLLDSTPQVRGRPPSLDEAVVRIVEPIYRAVS